MCQRYPPTPPPPSWPTISEATSPSSDATTSPPLAVPAICNDALRLLKWAFLPGWSNRPKPSFSNVNARRETVANSTANRGSFHHEQSLMPADG